MSKRRSETHFQPPGGTWTDENTPAHLAAMKAAHDRALEYERLYTRHGKVAHLSPPWRVKDVLCAVLPQWPGDWLGTGSQAEHELAAELETCSRCRRIFTGSVRCGNPECPCNAGAGDAR